MSELPSELSSNKPDSRIFVIILLSIFIFLVSVFAWYFGTKSSKQSDLSKSNQKAISTPEPTSIYPSITIDQSPDLPDGWVYKSNGWCDVKAPIPPQTTPYYTPYDPDYQPRDQYDDTKGGYYWDYPDGGFSAELLSKITTDVDAIQTFSNIIYKSDHYGGSGTIPGSVSINCMENTYDYNNSDMLIYLSNALKAYNQTSGEKGMFADKYFIENATDTHRWGYDVVDLIIKAHYNNSGGDPIMLKKQITLFVTEKYLYEIRIESQFTNPFILQTAKEIFNRLVIDNRQDVTVAPSPSPINKSTIGYPMIVCSTDDDCGGGCMRCAVTSSDCTNICETGANQ